jgi:hypothetical protein
MGVAVGGRRRGQRGHDRGVGEQDRQHPGGPMAEHVTRVAVVGDDGTAANVTKSSVSTPSTSARR